MSNFKRRKQKKRDMWDHYTLGKIGSRPKDRFKGKERVNRDEAAKDAAGRCWGDELEPWKSWPLGERYV